MRKDYKIIRPVGLRPKPDKYEERVAEICADYFNSNIEFVLRDNHTTPDIRVVRTRQSWEIKNIKGGGRHMIENNLRRASKQSRNVIISLLKGPKMSDRRVEAQVRHTLKTANVRLDHVLLITRDEKVIDVK